MGFHGPLYYSYEHLCRRTPVTQGIWSQPWIPYLCQLCFSSSPHHVHGGSQMDVSSQKWSQSSSGIWHMELMAATDEGHKHTGHQEWTASVSDWCFCHCSKLYCQYKRIQMPLSVIFLFSLSSEEYFLHPPLRFAYSPLSLLSNIQSTSLEQAELLGLPLSWPSVVWALTSPSGTYAPLK